MYESFFGFTRRPFASAPQIEQYFPGSAIEEARLTLVRCLERGEGVGMLVGSSGTGKTLLCQVLVEQFRDMFRVALLAGGRPANRRALYQSILHALGRRYRGLDESESRLALTDYLTKHKSCPRGIVLLVDEAHTLPLGMLDELRMLTNLSRDGEPLVRLILAGANSLEEHFTNPKLDSFSQRIVARCYLEPFNRLETQDYIQSGIEAVGGNGETVFAEETCRGVHDLTEGVPRLINQLCDQSLLSASDANAQSVDPPCVETAWAILQQLPMPNPASEETPTGGGGVIEFGGLDDMPGDEDGFDADSAIEHGEMPSCVDETADESFVDEMPDDMADDMAADDIQPEPADTATDDVYEIAEDSSIDEYPLADETPDSAEADLEPAVSVEFETDELVVEDLPEEESMPEFAVTEPEAIPGELVPEELLPEELVAEEPVAEEADADEPQQPAPVDDAFRPVGTIGPGIARMVETSEAPFDERFVVEEVIADRYSSTVESTNVLPEHAFERPVVTTDDVNPASNDVLVVEDQYDIPPTDPVAPVRRQDYRQLFSKLRQE